MKSEEYAAWAKTLNPIDDDLFKKMAEDIEFCQEIIRVILGKPDIQVLELKQQDSVKNLQGRSVILDGRCIDALGIHFAVEVQKSDSDNHQRRVRYNASCVTANITDPGSNFKNVPNLCSIYISKSDFLKGGKTVYHIDRVIRETGEIVDNGFSEIYVNAHIKDGSPASQLMTIFTENDVYDDTNFPVTSHRKRYFKQNQEGVSEVCEIMQMIKNEGISEGQRRLALQLYYDDILSLPQAAAYLNLSVDEFLTLKNSIESE